MTEPPLSVAEECITDSSRALTDPGPAECVLCYCSRMVAEYGCDNTPRWARRWRDARAPRATALLRRLAARGGYCDCEIFLNGWGLRVGLLDLDGETGDLDLPPEDPCCEGVRAGSSQPCELWVPYGPGW